MPGYIMKVYEVMDHDTDTLKDSLSNKNECKAFGG